MRPPDETTTGAFRSCVYAVMREGVCLYVGSTTRSLGARFSHHHAINNKRRPLFASDEILVWYCAPEDVLAVERDAIRDLCPTFNTRPVPSSKEDTSPVQAQDATAGRGDTRPAGVRSSCRLPAASPAPPDRPATLHPDPS